MPIQPVCTWGWGGVVYSVPCDYHKHSASATCLKLLVMRLADVQWPAPLSLHSMFYRRIINARFLLLLSPLKQARFTWRHGIFSAMWLSCFNQAGFTWRRHVIFRAMCVSCLYQAQFTWCHVIFSAMWVSRLNEARFTWRRVIFNATWVSRLNEARFTRRHVIFSAMWVSRLISQLHMCYMIPKYKFLVIIIIIIIIITLEVSLVHMTSRVCTKPFTVVTVSIMFQSYFNCH